MADSLATLTYLQLRLAGNQLNNNIEAAPDTITIRRGLDYIFEIYTPTAYQSGSFEPSIKISSKERPKVTEMGISYYPGADLDIAPYINDKLNALAPQHNQTAIALAGEMTSQYYVKTWIENNGVLVAGTEKTSAIQTAIKAKVAVEQASDWRDEFFTTFLSATKNFLTWQPNNKLVEKRQPEFLYFLVNFTPLPTTLRLRVELFLSDGSSQIITAQSNNYVYQNSVYCVPVGYDALNIQAYESPAVYVHSYHVWISNQNNARLSEIRTYRINQDFERNLAYIIFKNSLNGYDTLRAYGQKTSALQIRGTNVQVALSPNYLPETAEFFTIDKRGNRTLTINTGNLPEHNLTYLAELSFTEDSYVLAKEGFIALELQDTAYNLPADDEDLGGRTFNFRYAKTEIGISFLPQAPAIPLRPIKWVGIQPYCLVNANFIYTGFQGFSRVELRYQDDNSLVFPRKTKLNTSGTEGYVAPLLTAACSITPFLNLLYSADSSFTRNNCPPGYTGTIPTITIPAGTWGSLISQTEADARALADWQSQNTQAVANTQGTCFNYIAGGLAGKYFQYPNPNSLPHEPPANVFTFPSQDRVDTNFDLNLATNWTLPAGMANEFFVVRWLGKLKAPHTGNITFHILHDDGVRLYVNNVLIINGWAEAGSGTGHYGSISLVQNQLYDFRMEYFNYSGPAQVRLHWEYNGQYMFAIPPANLYY